MTNVKLFTQAFSANVVTESAYSRQLKHDSSYNPTHGISDKYRTANS